MPQGNFIALVIFPSLLLLFGVTALVIGLVRHRRYMEGLRRKRAIQSTVKRTSSALARGPQIVLTNVMADGGTLLVAYEPLGASEGGGGESGTFVAFDPGGEAFSKLDQWCRSLACVRVEVDYPAARLRVAHLADAEQLELSIAPEATNS